MALPTTTWLYNSTTSDGANSGNDSGGAGAGGSNWIVIDRAADKLIFLDDQQSDGDSNAGAIYPVIIPSAGTQESDKTFINNDSDSILDQVPLAGTTDGQQSGGNTRYVFAIYFNGATATTPFIEAWDDSTHTTTDDDFLGAGVAANSTLKAVSTTAAAPGSATWSGTPLAGTGSRIDLNGAALASAKNLYFNIKQVLASTFAAQNDTSIVLTLRFSYS